jgi:YihY family inner membrane protein
MNILQQLISRIDIFQQRHKPLAFGYAVIKKYGEDKAGYQAALLTYYGFLSLFPLLLVLTTTVGVLANHHPGLQQTVLTSVTKYFPMLGGQLSAHVHSLHKSGIALAVGILFTLYGARGVADVFRVGVNHVWRGPAARQDPFPKSLAKSFSLIVVGGFGLMLASLSAGYAGTVGHGALFRLLSTAINIFILFWLFTFLLNVSLPRRVSLKEIRPGAISAAIGLVILQSAGSFLLARELKNLDALYSTFAIALGLLFWIYLQAQVVYYSVEIAAVQSRGLWPRALNSSNATAVDRKLAGRQGPLLGNGD